jgi:hypothetical protein
MRTYDVYGIGNAITDLQLRTDDDFLSAIGVDKGIMTLVDEARQSEVLQALDGQAVHRCSGGSACNTIVGIADFGGRTAYACKVGADATGHRYLAELRELGVAVEVPQAPGQSGTCVVLITPDAQRTMLTHLGISSELSEVDIVEAEIAKARYIYVEGYLFAGDGTRAAALKAIRLAKKNGVKVALTVSDPFLIQLCRDTFWELIKGPVDLLFCNHEEATALTGEGDAVACAQAIHAHAANVALTLGRQGSLLMHDGELTPIEGVAVSAVDTTGAGDMYAAGVLYGINNGLSWKQAGHLGSHAAARIVSQLGARLGRRFTPEEIRVLLA